MDLPDPNEDLLAQPTRARIFALLVERRAETGTEEIADRLGLHPNGVRRHLERLLGAGLVERRRARGARGRPQDRWAVAARARPGGRHPSGYAELSRWLARATPATPARLREVKRVGRDIGRELAPERPSADPVDAFRQAIAALGFEPEVEVRDGGFCCRLENCPYRDSVHAGGEVVCTLHRGLTAGLLDALHPDAELTGFVPKDPDLAGCLVEVASPG